MSIYTDSFQSIWPSFYVLMLIEYNYPADW